MRLRQILRKVHRWIGLLSALWLLQLAVTGLMLQHADDWGLSKAYVKNATVLQWFDYGKYQVAWDVEGQSLYQIDDRIIIDGNTSTLSAEVLSVVKDNKLWLVATANSIIWFNQQADKVQQLDDFDGLPTPVKHINVVKGVLKVTTDQASFSQTKTGDFAPHKYPMIESETVSRSLTKEEKAQLLPQAFANQLSNDKVIYAIHSGMKSIPLLNTLSALALIYLSLSGIYLFIKPSFKRRNKA